MINKKDIDIISIIQNKTLLPEELTDCVNQLESSGDNFIAFKKFQKFCYPIKKDSQQIRALESIFQEFQKTYI